MWWWFSVRSKLCVSHDRLQIPLTHPPRQRSWDVGRSINKMGVWLVINTTERRTYSTIPWLARLITGIYPSFTFVVLQRSLVYSRSGWMKLRRLTRELDRDEAIKDGLCAKAFMVFRKNTTGMWFWWGSDGVSWRWCDSSTASTAKSRLITSTNTKWDVATHGHRWQTVEATRQPMIISHIGLLVILFSVIMPH